MSDRAFLIFDLPGGGDFRFITDFCGIKSFAQAFLKACGFQRQRLWSPTAVGEILGNTAQIAAHALLESYSVSLHINPLTCVSKSAVFLCNLTKNLTSQSAHPNVAVLP